LIMLSILLSRLIVEVPALTGNLEMGLCRTPCRLAAAMTAFLAPAQLALLASQRLLGAPIETRVLNRAPLTVSEERFETHIHADSRMRTFRWGMVAVGISLTDDQRIPMAVSTIDKMDGLGGSLYRAMHVDLEEFSKFRRDM